MKRHIQNLSQSTVLFALLFNPAFAQSPEILADEAMQLANSIAATATSNADISAAVEVAERAIETAQRALTRDDSIAIAHAALGLSYRQTWQWGMAEASFTRAYSLDPDNPAIAFNYAWFSAFSGKADRSFAVANRAIDLDPDSANAQRDLGIVYAYAGLPQAATGGLQGCITRNPAIGVCHIYRGFMQTHLGNFELAEMEIREAERLFGDGISPAAASSLAHAYHRLGQNGDARRMVEILEQMNNERVVGLGTWPLAYLAIEDSEAAYNALQMAIDKMTRGEPDEGFFNLMIIKANIQGNPVLETPRFKELRERIGYP